MKLPREFFYEEVRDGFYIPGMVKRAWGAALTILSEIDRICKKHGIQYHISAGTLLGAVREGAFIPWDDDLDIIMLRDEFNKFWSVAKAELPKELTFTFDVGHMDRSGYLAAVGISEMYFRPEILRKYCEYPYPAAIDVFILDDLAKNPEDEEYRKDVLHILYTMIGLVESNKEKSRSFLKELEKVEELLEIQFDRNSPLAPQLYDIFHRVCQEFNGTGDTVAFLAYQMHHEKTKFPKAAFQGSKQISFCNREFPAPIDYDTVLKVIYGDYKKPVKAGGIHNYPYFRQYEDRLQKLFGEKWVFSYQFKEEDLERPNVENFREILFKTVDYFLERQKKILEACKKKDFLFLHTGLPTCQEEAIALGNAIEAKKGEGCESVSLLEQYCETLYHAYQALEEALHSDEKETDRVLSESGMQVERMLKQSGSHLRKLRQALEGEFKRQIVFLPHSAKHFDSLRPLIDALAAEDDVECKIIPIPYFDRLGDGNFSEMHYEGKEFPEGYEITDYRTYDFATELPDCIVLNSPYDEVNPVWSVASFFYSRKMKNYTRKLVYIPPFVTDEINPKAEEDGKAFGNMEYYVTVPGVFHADLTIVQSEEMKKAYLAKIARFAKGGVSKKMRKKISGAGSCLFGEKKGQGTKEVLEEFKSFLQK